MFDDPFAAAFVAAMPDAYADASTRSAEAREVGARLAAHVVVRTKFYDDYLLDATSSGIRQVVLLAAGLDTRAFRLPWPEGTTVVEVDLPETLAFKEQVLTERNSMPTCHRHVVVADLTADWAAAVRDAGFDPAQPTAWLVEGLLIYLTHDDAARLLETVADLSAPGSTVSCEQGRSAMQLAARGGSEATALWQGGISDIASWLTEHAWSVEKHELSDLARDYGRPFAEETTSTGFVIARR